MYNYLLSSPCIQKPSSKLKKKTFATPSGEYYPIERILAHKTDSAGKVFCLVRWENYSQAYDTWEPFDNFTEDMKSEILANK